MSHLDLVSPTIIHIRQALLSPLPGLAGQIKMAPEHRVDQVNRWERATNSREASVLILLYPGDLDSLEITITELYFVLIRRPEYPGVHSGQISLPGGRREEGEPLKLTALRETHEEIGLNPDQVEIIGQLSPLFTPPSNFYIYPFVGFSPIRPTFRPDIKEVAELIETPLKLLCDPAIRKEDLWYLPNFGQRRVPFFDIFGHAVWGATAMILSEFITLLDRW